MAEVAGWAVIPRTPAARTQDRGYRGKETHTSWGTVDKDSGTQSFHRSNHLMEDQTCPQNLRTDMFPPSPAWNMPSSPLGQPGNRGCTQQAQLPRRVWIHIQRGRSSVLRPPENLPPVFRELRCTIRLFQISFLSRLLPERDGCHLIDFSDLNEKTHQTNRNISQCPQKLGSLHL